MLGARARGAECRAIRGLRGGGWLSVCVWGRQAAVRRPSGSPQLSSDSESARRLAPFEPRAHGHYYISLAPFSARGGRGQIVASKSAVDKINIVQLIFNLLSKHN